MGSMQDLLKFYQEIGCGFLGMKLKNPKLELAELVKSILSCQKCPLHQTKTRYVPGEGAMNPPVMFIGEGPGETEDQFGKPFIGKAGQLLERIIVRMGLSRSGVFIGNVVKCRPPSNREPSLEEVTACLPYLERQIELIQPRSIVCLGKTAVSHLLGDVSPMNKMRGKILYYRGIPVVPTYHPSYILHQKNPEEISRAKWEVWEDMQVVLKLLGD